MSFFHHGSTSPWTFPLGTSFSHKLHKGVLLPPPLTGLMLKTVKKRAKLETKCLNSIFQVTANSILPGTVRAPGATWCPVSQSQPLLGAGGFVLERGSSPRKSEHGQSPHLLFRFLLPPLFLPTKHKGSGSCPLPAQPSLPPLGISAATSSLSLNFNASP